MSRRDFGYLDGLSNEMCTVQLLVHIFAFFTFNTLCSFLNYHEEITFKKTWLHSAKNTFWLGAPDYVWSVWHVGRNDPL